MLRQIREMDAGVHELSVARCADRAAVRRTLIMQCVLLLLVGLLVCLAGLLNLERLRRGA